MMISHDPYRNPGVTTLMSVSGYGDDPTQGQGAERPCCFKFVILGALVGWIFKRPGLGAVAGAAYGLTRR